MIEVVEEVVTVDITEEVIVVEMGDAVPLEWGRITGDLSDQEDLNWALYWKANKNHIHDDRYYTEAESDALLAGKADAVHVHDDRYYVKAESDAALAGKQDVLVFDEVPTESSLNPVRSGGVFDALADSALTGSVSGGLVSVSDGADAAAADLSVGIVPVQDLRGYDRPWPDGGGKNLLPKGASSTSGGVTFTVQDDGSVKTSGTSTTTGFWGVQFTIPAGTYTFSGCPTNSSNIICDIRDAVGGTGLGYGSDSGSGKMFTNESDVTAYFNIRIPSGVNTNNLVFYPMIETGSSKTTYAPYSNICPITGWDACKVTRTGRNLYPITLDNDKWMNNAGATNSKSNGVITVNISNPAATSMGVYTPTASTLNQLVQSLLGREISWSFDIRVSVENSNVRAGIQNVKLGYYTLSTEWQHISDSAVVPINGNGFTPFNIYNTTGNTQAFSIEVKNLQIELGSSATAYEPYQGQTVTIDLGGTRYGGMLDVTSGVLRVTKMYYLFDGTEGWWEQTAGSNIYCINCEKGVSNVGPMCNMFKWVNMSANEPDNSIRFAAALARIYVIHPTISSNLTEFRGYLAGHNLQVCYDLAAPFSVQLSPAEVRILSGLCNVWADTGDCSLVYWRSAGAGAALGLGNVCRNGVLGDVLTRGMITEFMEVSMMATRNYVTGDVLIAGDLLYRATANVGSGSALTEGVNVERITLVDYILDVLQ